MGLGDNSTKLENFREWSINLFHPDDTDWNDNTWIIDHLRMLANKIEKENPQILNINLNTKKMHDEQNKIIYLTIGVYIKN